MPRDLVLGISPTAVGDQGHRSRLPARSVLLLRSGVHRTPAPLDPAAFVKALDKLERKMGSKTFRETFVTITCDNGCENLDFEGIERSCLTTIQRTKVYYAHPYSAWERGSKENANKLIRRFIPKGADIAEFSLRRIKMIENWINNYPRRIFNGLSANDLLKNQNVA